MEELCSPEMLGYQQIINGMKFSIDQLDKQIKSIDERMENTWMDLKEICENFFGEKFDGTLEAVDHFFVSKMLENSVCSADSCDSIATVCQELISFMKHNPGHENEVFDCLLRVQFKEGLNFPICFKNDGQCESSRKSLFDSDQHFNELCTTLQQHFLNQLLREETSHSTLMTQRNGMQLKEKSDNYLDFAEEKLVEEKQKCFQRLCLLSNPDHVLVLYANSKSLFVQRIIKELKTGSSEFIKCGKALMNMMVKDAMLLRLCVEEGDVINFISTVYLDPIVVSLEPLAEKWKQNFETSKNEICPDKSELSKKHSQVNMKSGGQIEHEDMHELLQMIGWLIEADAMIVQVQESSLRCLVEQERSRVRNCGNENQSGLKSALKNSDEGKMKKSLQPILTTVFRWKSLFEKFISPLMLYFESNLKECCRSPNNFIATPVPPSLQYEIHKCTSASKNSILIVENMEKFLSFMRFISSSSKNLSEKLQDLFHESFSENLKMISSKVDKDITIESLVVILSGIDFLEEYFVQLALDLQISDTGAADLLHTAKKDLMNLVQTKFIDIITVSIWYNGNGDDISNKEMEEDKEPDCWIQNWWLQMEWLWSELVNCCSFEVTRKIILGCLGECLKNFAWYFASKRIGKQGVEKFVVNVRSLLDRSLDLLLRSCARSEEIIDACSNDGMIYEIHVACVSLTITLFVSAMPLPLLKEMYNQFTSQPKHVTQSEAVINRECQWLHIAKQDWKLFGKTRLDQLETEATYDIMFNLLEHYPFEKQYLLLQMMFMHDSHFIVKILELLFCHEATITKHDGSDCNNDRGDYDGGDKAGVARVIWSLLTIIFSFHPDEEPVLVHVLEKIMKNNPDKVLFGQNSTLFRFLCSSLEPVLLSIIWKILKEIESVSLPASICNISYLSQDRLFCGCKPSMAEVQCRKDDTNCVKVFTLGLLENFHRLPYLTTRICFRLDELKTKSSAGNETLLFIKILLAALQKVLSKIKNMSMFSESHSAIMTSIVQKFHDLTSSSSLPSHENKWFKEEFLEKVCSLGEEILINGKDDNDPGLGTPRSHLSSLVFETLLHSIKINKSAKRSMDDMTLFFMDNFCQLKAVFGAIDSTECLRESNEGSSTVLLLNFSSFRGADGESTKEHCKSNYNPLKSLEVFKLGKPDIQMINWNLYSKLDLGLTEVNLPNLLVNRPEFRGNDNSDLDSSSREFVDLLKQKHLKDSK